MFRSIVIAATAASFAVVAVPLPASAQTVIQGAISPGCDPATGRRPDGRVCKGLIPLSNDRINAGAPLPNVRTLDRSTLAETFECRDLDELQGVGVAVERVVEDCGTPAPLADLNNFQAFSGEVAAVAPPPPPVAALPPQPVPCVPCAPPPVAALPPPPPVIAAAPPVVAAVPVAAAGLGGIVPIALGAAGLAALVGVAALINDDDDNNSTTTSSRRVN